MSEIIISEEAVREWHIKTHTNTVAHYNKEIIILMGHQNMSMNDAVESSRNLLLASGWTARSFWRPSYYVKEMLPLYMNGYRKRAQLLLDSSERTNGILFLKVPALHSNSWGLASDLLQAHRWSWGSSLDFLFKLWNWGDSSVLQMET